MRLHRAFVVLLPAAFLVCAVLQAVSTPHGFWYPFAVPHELPYTDGLRIQYVNRSNKTANRVLFLVDYRGDRERVVDAGTFSPNVTIDHTFGQFTGDAYLGPKPNVCRAVAVRFVDGTFWRASSLRYRPEASAR